MSTNSSNAFNWFWLGTVVGNVIGLVAGAWIASNHVSSHDDINKKNRELVGRAFEIAISPNVTIGTGVEVQVEPGLSKEVIYLRGVNKEILQAKGSNCDKILANYKPKSPLVAPNP